MFSDPMERAVCKLKGCCIMIEEYWKPHEIKAADKYLH